MKMGIIARLVDWYSRAKTWLYINNFWRGLRPGKSVSLLRAEKMAQLLLEHGVEEVLLFGGVARRGAGDDIDLVSIVDYEQSDCFLQQLCMYYLIVPDSYSLVYERKEIACRILGINSLKDIYPLEGGLTLEEVRNFHGREDNSWLKWSRQVTDLDIFLFSDGWENNLLLDEQLKNKDPNFLQNIAKDIRGYDSDKGCFEKLGLWRTYLGGPACTICFGLGQIVKAVACRGKRTKLYRELWRWKKERIRMQYS